MFLVMGITGKVGGATAEHLLARGKEVRALVRNREKASSWANRGVELVDGDWNDAAAIERALKGVEGAFVMLPAVWAPFARFQRSQGRDCELCRGAHEGSTAASGCALVDGCEQDQRDRDDHGVVASGATFSQPDIAQSYLCAQVDSSKTSSTACRSPRAERYPSITPRRTGNRPWSRRTTSAQRSQPF